MISLVVQTKALHSLQNVCSAQKNVRMLLKKENNYNYNPVLYNIIVIRPVTYIRIQRVNTVNTGDQRTSFKAQQPAKRKSPMAQVAAEHPVTVYLSINSLRGKTSVQIWTEKWPIVSGSAALHVFKSNATELHFLHCMIICALILPLQKERCFSHVLPAENGCWGADKKKDEGTGNTSPSYALPLSTTAN